MAAFSVDETLTSELVRDYFARSDLGANTSSDPGRIPRAKPENRCPYQPTGCLSGSCRAPAHASLKHYATFNARPTSVCRPRRIFGDTGVSRHLQVPTSTSLPNIAAGRHTGDVGRALMWAYVLEGSCAGGGQIHLNIPVG